MSSENSPPTADASQKAIDELYALRSQAARWKEQFERRQQDRAFEAEGGVVLYALDNDVVTNITAPWRAKLDQPLTQGEERRQRRRRLHYQRNLLLDDPVALESFNYIVAEYFLRRHPSRPIPFLLMHPGNVELQDTWNKAYEQAKRDSTSLENDYREALEMLKESPVMPEVEVSKRNQTLTEDVKLTLETSVRELLTCLHRRRGAIAELQRIVMLQEGNNILPLDRIVVGDSALAPVPDTEGKRQIADFKASWLDDLNKKRTPRPRTGGTDVDLWPTNNHIDAEVLGKLEWINQQFARDAAAGGPMRRLCFVTGDRTIEAVAERRVLGTTTFDKVYLRSPACFLSDWEFFDLAGVEAPDFLANFSASPLAATAGVAEASGPELRRSLDHWLRVLFPDLHPSRGQGEIITKEAYKKIALTAQQARLSWAEYLKFTAADANLRQADDAFEGLVREVIGSFDRGYDELRMRLQRLRGQARFVSDEAMASFGVAGLLAGFWSLDHTGDRWPNRLIPAIRFESFPQARALINRLRESPKLREAQHDLEESKLASLLDEDGTRYTRFVVFAMAFALAGDWPSALTVATAAFSVASTLDREQWPDSRVKGDEAAYLCAVFRRLCAKRSADLDESDRWLVIAREFQLSEPLRPRLAALPDPASYRDPRFVAEALAIGISRLQFAEFMDDPSRPEVVELHDCIRKLCDQHLQVLAMLDTEPTEEVRDAVSQRIATGFLQLQLFAKLKADTENERREDAVRMIRLLQQYDVDQSRQSASEQEARHSQMPIVARLVYLCSRALFLPPEAGDSAAREQLLENIKRTAKRVEETVVVPYDPIRAQLLVQLVENNFAANS